ncbi:MAG: GlmU family protein [Saprospiraceae bacterium]|nr:GlmU family protein [Saprospiraceae bacterium]MDW8484752.1 GlmU family protein [Saprospiraceae bacterium]
MQNLILFDSDARNHLLPLTATRPMGELRIGIFTIRGKWERYLNSYASYITQEYLQEKYPIRVESENLVVNGGILPNELLCQRIAQLGFSEALLRDGELIATRLDALQFETLIEDEEVRELQGIELEADIPIVRIQRLWELTQQNGAAIEADFQWIVRNRQSAPLPDSNRLIGPADRLFIEPDARIEACTLNTTEGPIYIGKNAEVMEGCLLRGPIAIGEGAVLKMGARIYGPTTIGPGCKIGGEVTRSIFIGNSNKAHEGFIGDSVIGEWCNIGADTNNSNLKNNYSEVKLWDYAEESFVRTGTQLCGLFMGDHAKCGINTMFNTGTVVGVFANVFGSGYPRHFIPDFAWGGPDSGFRTYTFEEACATAQRVLQRRNRNLTDLDKAILRHIYEQTASLRPWEK